MRWVVSQCVDCDASMIKKAPNHWRCAACKAEHRRQWYRERGNKRPSRSKSYRKAKRGSGLESKRRRERLNRDPILHAVYSAQSYASKQRRRALLKKLVEDATPIIEFLKGDGNDYAT